MHTASWSGSTTAVSSYAPCIESSDRIYVGVLPGAPGSCAGGIRPTGSVRSSCSSAGDKLVDPLTTFGSSLPFLI